MSNEKITEAEALAELQKFGMACYTKGSNDALIGVVAGAGLASLAIVGWMMFYEWRNRKKSKINQSEGES